MSRTPSPRRAVAATLLAISAACAGKTASEPPGVLTVGLTTIGADAATLSFAVEVTASRADAGPSRSEQAKADGGIATFRDLNAGSYVVRLSLPQRCEASGGSTRQLTIAPRRTTAVRFAVTCR